MIFNNKIIMTLITIIDEEHNKEWINNQANYEN